MPLTGLVIALTGGGSDARRVLSAPAVDTYVAPQRALTRHGFQARCASGVYSRLFRRGDTRTAFYGPKAQISKGLSHEHYLSYSKLKTRQSWVGQASTPSAEFGRFLLAISHRAFHGLPFI